MVLNPGTLMKLQVQWPGRIVRFCVYCVVLNPVDTFLNRKAKSGVRKIAVAELVIRPSGTLLQVYLW